MLNPVKCLYCGESFYREDTDYVKPQSNRYAHRECAEEADKIHKLAQEVLGGYYLKQRVNANIRDFVKDGMSLKDIYDLAYYSYKIQKNREVSPAKSNGGFGIIIYFAQEYKQYKLQQELKKRLNKNKKIENYVDKEGQKVTFTIPPIKKPRGLNFFDLR